MYYSHTYTANQIEKLGNAIVYLCEKLQPYNTVSKTHILKLIFILEELSVRQFGIPFFGLRFEVWKMGPVATDLYFELTETPNLLARFIRVENKRDRTEVIPIQTFSDDEFSDLELELLENVAERFKYCTAKELINFTHRKESPWYITAQKHGLVDDLEAGRMNTTDILVELESTIIENGEKRSPYEAHLAFLAQTHSLKA